MRDLLDEAHRDRAVAALAERHHGVVTSSQLNGVGLDKHAIRRRVAAGRLHRIHRSVYAVGHKRLTREGRFLAAVLARGPRAVLSHHAAAVHWALLPERGPRIEVTVPSGGGRTRKGAIIVHRSPLPEAHVTVKDAVPVTTPARTIIDLADYGNRRQLERVRDEAHFLRLDLADLQPIAGRRGAGLLAGIIAEHQPGTTRTRRELEELMLLLCRRHDIEQPQVNANIEGYEVDFSWTRQRLIVETDGWQAHGTRAAFERDRIRDADLAVAGWRVVRITWRRIEHEPDVVAQQLKRLLAL